MRPTLVLFSTLLAAAALAACGGSTPPTGDDDTPPTDAPGGDHDGSSTGDAAPEGPCGTIVDETGWTRLVARTWTLEAGQPDTYKCVRVRVEQDMLITQMRALAPLGTHHTVVTIKDTLSGNDREGEYDCAAFSVDPQMLFASGVGSNDLVTPDGVAIQVRAGQYVNLNLHLFNASDNALACESGILVKTVPDRPGLQHAEMVFAGTFSINIPPDGQPHTAQGGCSFNAPTNVFAYWPHMHQHATHQRVVLNQGGNDVVLHDDAYTFTEQKFYREAQPIAIAAGDSIQVTCTYENNDAERVCFGDSSTQEMCFTGLFRYPATGQNIFSCTSGNPGFCPP